MSNEIGFSLSVGEFKDRYEEPEEIVKHLMRFTGMGISIKIEDGWIASDEGTFIEAHGWAPWMSSLNWFIDFVQEKGCSADLSMRDGLGNSRAEAQWREGKCVYQRNGYIYYFEDGNYEKEIVYDDDDEKGITYKKGEEGLPLEDYLREKAEALREKEAAADYEAYLKEQEKRDKGTDAINPFDDLPF